MIRLLLVVIAIAIYVILSIILIPFGWVMRKINPAAEAKYSKFLIQNLFRVFKFLSGVKTKVIGLENIPKDEAVLFVGNHLGFFDVIVSYCYMPNITGYIAKKEFEKVIVLSNWMRGIRCLFLDRENAREGLKTILQGIEDIKNGTSLVIFPEGTRNKSKEGLLPFHQGSFKLAEKSNCKIIPMVQVNTSAVFEDHFPWLKSAHTILEFGEPIDVSSLSREDKKNLCNYTHDLIEKMYEKNKTLL